MSDQGVTAVHRVMKKVGDDLVPTRTVFLTFDSVDLPSKVKAGYEVISVRPYIPNTLLPLSKVQSHSSILS